MRGSKAKALRRQVYGSDMSHRERTYQYQGGFFDGRFVLVAGGKKYYRATCICTGLRRKYHDAKAAYRAIGA